MMKRVVLSLTLIFFTFYGYSQQWTFLDFPGEKINDIAVHPENPGTIFVCGNKVYKSTDGGNSWDTVYNHFNSIVFHPNPDTMYATLGLGSYSDGVYKSGNGGDSWSISGWMFRASSVMVPSYPDGSVIAGSKGEGVYESSDYGNTWTQMNDSLTNKNVLALEHINPGAPDSGQIYLAGTKGGIFYYPDTGEYWHKANPATDLPPVPAFSSDSTGDNLWAAIDGGSNSDGMYKSEDYGETWDVSEYWIFITDILVNPLNPNTVYAADSSGGVKMTTNGGMNWETINTGLDDSVVYCLALSQADTSKLYAGTLNGVYVMDFPNEVREISENNMTVYPNPANDKLEIQLSKKAKLEIRNARGQIIENLEMENTSTTLDITKYASGIYLIKAETDEGIMVKKFIKE
ncbi:MAG: T9SS type A sorting domain-containing protein [Bacteroidales bacterium]|nr:T9SS type A sorting domain-containing protein [Bacteroidales bacterium]MCF8337403.1 T9SS type A sorting domain-containing protein [Bacteroidales bacterium]